MSWAKVDDQFFSHPKARAAGKDGRALFLAGLCYCANHLTNGKIEKPAVALVLALADVRQLAVKVLVSVGLWHDRGDHYEVHDYLLYNPPAEKVLAERAAAAERMRNVRQNRPRSSPEQEPNVDRSSPNPVPVPEVLSEPVGRKRRPPADFVPTDEHRTYATANGLELDDEREHWILHCEAKNVTYARLNAGFATWLRNSVKFGHGSKPATNGHAPAQAQGVPVPKNDHCLVCGRRFELCEGHDIGKREVTPMFKTKVR